LFHAVVGARHEVIDDHADGTIKVGRKADVLLDFWAFCFLHAAPHLAVSV